MKACNNCGATLNDNDTFCSNCGNNVPAARSQQNAKTPVSIGGWIGRSLIPLIPVVGGIIYFIMLFVWGGDSKKEDSFRNWAKAQLIIIAIVAIPTIILAIVFGASIVEILEYMF